MKLLRNVLLAIVFLLALNCGAWWLVGKERVEHDVLLDLIDDFIEATREGVDPPYYLLVCPSSKNQLSVFEWTSMAEKLADEGVELISSEDLDEFGRAPKREIRTVVCTDIEKQYPLYTSIRVSSGVGLRAGYGRSYFEHRVYLGGHWFRVYRSGGYIHF